MYLGNVKVKARGFNSGFTPGDIDKPLAPEALKLLVKELRCCSQEAAKQIIRAHMGLTLQIVGRYVGYYPKKTDDILGVAMVQLVEAVYSFPKVSNNDDITPYIVSSLHGHISNFIRDDTTVRISRYGLTQLYEEYKKTGEKNKPMTVSIDLPKITPIGRQVTKAVSTQDDYETKLEVEDFIEELNFTRFEAIVLRLLVDGWLEVDIAKQLNVSRQRINQVKLLIKVKLAPYYEEVESESVS